MGHETYANKFALRPLAYGRRGMVATANPLATLAGLRMFARGGNAVDAIVAAAAAVGVAEPYMSGLAGCGVALVSRPGQAPRVLNFLGYAPASARREALPQAARDMGILSVSVPGNLAGWGRLLADHGTVSLAEALEPAIELAEAGAPMTVFDRQMFDEHHKNLNPEGVRTYLHDGRVPELGRPVVQRDLAASFRTIARDGVGALYEGELGHALARDMRELGGLITLDDLKRYPGTLQWTDALVTTYRGVSVYAPPPPASALQILQTLNGMAGWELGRMEHLGPDHLAVIAEASRAARMDTERYLGDPAFVDVPVARLLSGERTARAAGGDAGAPGAAAGAGAGGRGGHPRGVGLDDAPGRV